MKIEIKSRFSLEVLFSHDCENNSVAVTLAAAINAKANLYGANLGDAGKLTGDRPYFAVGPIGSRKDVLAAFLTEKGVYLRAGCFFGTVEQFREKLEDDHGDNIHGNEYRAALHLVLAHYEAWPATPVEEEAPAES